MFCTLQIEIEVLDVNGASWLRRCSSYGLKTPFLCSARWLKISLCNLQELCLCIRIGPINISPFVGFIGKLENQGLF
jgi:hypothetical protein